ncbi:MAG: protein kinase [Planctomycetota bacterium]
MSLATKSCIECPTTETLIGLIEERLDPSLSDTIAMQVEQCQKCRETLQRLSGELHNIDDRIARRDPVITGHPEDPQWLKQLRAAGPPGSTREVKADENWRTLLHPPIDDDEMGRIGGLPVFELIGQGGMGIVLRGIDPKLHRPVAIKIMRQTLATQPRYRERFFREARAMAAIDHPHVVPVYHVGEHQGMPFMVMKLLNGQSLGQRLAEVGTMDTASLGSLADQATCALSAAHGYGLVHRDIKPSNLFLESPNDNVRVLDFGLARSDDQESSMTQPGDLLGTPAYMSPEQARGEELDCRSDWFSLGVVLYEAACGRTPFSGNSSLSTLARLMSDQPESLKHVRPSIDDEFNDRVMQLLEKNPDERHPWPAAKPELTSETAARSWRRPMGLVVAGLLLLACVTGLASTFMTIETPLGTVRLEFADGVDPSRVRVRLTSRGDVHIVGSQSSSEEDDFRVVVSEGTYTAELLNDDSRLKLDQESITVVEDEVETLRITIVETEFDPTSLDPITAQESLAWIVRVGGRYSLSEDPKDMLTKIVQLEDKPHQIFAVDLLGCDIEDEDLWNLRGFSSINHLAIGRKKITGSLPPSDENPRTQLSPAAFEYLAMLDFKWIKDLQVIGVPVGRVGLKSIAKLASLRSLLISQGNLQDEDLQSLSEHPSLVQLALTDCGITGIGLQNLAELPLQFFSFADRRMSLDKIEELPDWPSLKRLSLNGMSTCDLPERVIKSIGQRKQLRELSLIQFTNADSDMFFPLTQMSDLTSLSLIAIPGVDDVFLAKALKTEKALTSIDLRRSNVTDDGVRALAEAISLREIKLPYPGKITPESVSMLRDRLPDAVVIWDPNKSQ